MVEFLDELKLLISSKGVPPEIISAVVQKLVETGSEIEALVQSTIERNIAQETLAKVQTARLLKDMGAAERVLASGTDSVLANEMDAMAAKLLGEVASLVNGEEAPAVELPEA